MLHNLFKLFSSIKLTAVCLTLGCVIVFWGTIAQVHLGLFRAQNEFFRSFLVYWTPAGSGFHIPIFPGGYFIGTMLLVNLFLAHFRYYRFGGRNIGIVLIHLGVILLLLGQMLTDFLSRESLLHLRIGETKNYSESDRTFELAVLDTSDPDSNKVVAIPCPLLARGGDVSRPKMPFTVRVKTFYANSSLVQQPQPGYEPVKTTVSPASGIWWRKVPCETEINRMDMPSAIVEIVTPKSFIGTFLVSAWLDEPQSFACNGHSYELQLRQERHHLPFSLHLIEFRHDKYPGTDIPKNFSSRIRLQNPANGEDRETRIFMNNPLRYGGETFYQASFDPDDQGSVLQVVHNPSWLTPYFACVLVAAGLLVQFLSHLIHFGKRRDSEPGSAAVPAASDAASSRVAGRQDVSDRRRGGMIIGNWIPIILVVVMAGWIFCRLRQPPESGFDTRAFGKLPVLMNGRFQPFDSVARNSLLQIRTKQSVVQEENGKTQTLTATEWLLETMMKPELANDLKIFRIDNNEVLALLKLPDSQKYYSFNQLQPQMDELERQAGRIEAFDSSKRTVFESQLMKLYDAMNLFQRLEVSLKPPGSDDFAAELDAYQKSIAPGIVAVKACEAGQKFDQDAFNTLLGFMGGYNTVASFALPLTIPPANASLPRDAWQNIGTNLMQAARTGEINPATKFYAEMVTAYRAGQPDNFNRIVGQYRFWLVGRFTPQLRKADREFFFSAMEPFYKAIVIYVLALVLALLSWFNRADWLRRSAFYLAGLAWVIHTLGLGFRMYLEGRPPVTNLYSSAIFIGWAAVILGMVLEKTYRDGIGCVVAAFAGFVTLIIAHNLALGGDTMEMMRAVLDTNFWLATHVVTVTLGYASTFVAGFLAIIYILRGVFTATLTTETAKSLARMVYGIVCFATLFSFVGTVLGGIWADQSWGRFWGWDPKENGALLIVLWNALILHALRCGLVRERGLMNLAVFGNIVTSFSWFGVNMLGIGLHSYGFMDAAFFWLMIFVVSQATIILLGLLPRKLWRSFHSSTSA
jgi:ABC-type transport system involved in cytochrome c biogenesis permease subunit